MKGQIMKLIVLLILLFSIPVKVNAQLPEWEGYKRTYTPGNERDDYEYFLSGWPEEMREQAAEDLKTAYFNRYWDGQQWTYLLIAEGKVPEVIPVSYDVTYNYDEAYKMIDLVNEERKAKGRGELKTNDFLMQLAMERAAETALYFGHTRPDGSNHYTKHNFIKGENVHVGSADAESAFADWKASPGHYGNMMNGAYTHAGYGCVDSGLRKYWVQIFYGNGFSSVYEVDTDASKGFRDETKKLNIDSYPLTQMSNYSETFTTYLDVDNVTPTCAVYAYGKKPREPGNITNVAYYTDINWQPVQNPSNDNFLEQGESYSFYAATRDVDNGGWGSALLKDGYTIENLTPDICSLENGRLDALKGGTAKIKISVGSNSKTFDIIIKPEKIELETGEEFEQGGNTYEVLSSENHTIALEKAVVGSDQTYVYIPDTVEDGKVRYTVTEVKDNVYKDCKSLTMVSMGSKIQNIGKNTFSGCTKLKEVLIGTGVKKIGKGAFSGCKKLKRIIIYGTGLKSVGKNAISGVHKKCAIIVPKNKGKTYKKLFSKKTGFKKTMKVKKNKFQQ